MKRVYSIRLLTTGMWIVLMYLGVNRAGFITTPLFVATVILGPIFCSWFCPFGFLQNTVGKLARLLKLPKYEFHTDVHKYLKYSRYILFFVALLPFGMNGLATLGLEPRRTFTNLLAGEVDTVLSVVLFSTFVVASLFNERFYCKYFCTKGAEYSLVSSLRAFRIKRTSKCVSCKKCVKACPMQVDILKSEVINDISCISCLDCIGTCSVKGSIKYKKGLSVPTMISRKINGFKAK